MGDYSNIQKEKEYIDSKHDGKYNERLFRSSNYQMVVSNQSYDEDIILLKCYLDNELIFYDFFHVKDQHEYSYYFFDLESGLHQLSIESEHGIKIKETIKVDDEIQYPYITYWGKGKEGIISYWSSNDPYGLD